MPAALRPVEAISRLGTETAFDVLAHAEALAAQGRDIINLGIGQPDFKTPPHIVEAAVKALRDGHHGYTRRPASRSCARLSLRTSRRSAASTSDPSRVVVVPGGKVTMFFAILMFGEPGAEILYPNPGFPIYESVINFTGAKAVPIPLLEEKDFSFDADSVLASITPDTRLLIVNSPANPTGGTVPREPSSTSWSRAWRRIPTSPILSDEIYSRMTYDGQEHVSLLGYPEIGGPPHPARRLEQDLRHDWLAHRLRRLARIAGRSRDAPGGQLPLLRQRRDTVRRHRRAARARRTSVGHDGGRLRRASQGHRRRPERPARRQLPHARRRLLRLPQHQRHRHERAAAAGPLLEEAGVATIAGTSFGAYGEGYLRFSYANSVENIEKALGRMRDLLSS